MNIAISVSRLFDMHATKWHWHGHMYLSHSPRSINTCQVARQYNHSVRVSRRQCMSLLIPLTHQMQMENCQKKEQQTNKNVKNAILIECTSVQSQKLNDILNSNRAVLFITFWHSMWLCFFLQALFLSFERHMNESINSSNFSICIGQFDHRYLEKRNAMSRHNGVNKRESDSEWRPVKRKWKTHLL